MTEAAVPWERRFFMSLDVERRPKKGVASAEYIRRLGGVGRGELAQAGRDQSGLGGHLLRKFLAAKGFPGGEVEE